MEPYREPVVAGRFYTSNPRQLTTEVAHFLGEPKEPIAARAVVAPHAGYMYSGAIAGRGYRDVLVPSSAIVLCPNHTGLGARFSVWDCGAWMIPGGRIQVDEVLAAAVLDHAQANAVPLEPDRMAHLHEHSIEVHLPFLHAKRPDVRVVPICLHRMGWSECRALGRALASSVTQRRAAGDDVLLVASSDMSHYVCARDADRLDHLALNRIEALDPEGLLQVVTENGISMCGVIPTTVALVAALELGATSATVTAYGNSGETSGDLDRVVGYAAAVIH